MTAFVMALVGVWWFENWVARRSEERRRIKARLPRRVG